MARDRRSDLARSPTPAWLVGGAILLLALVAVLWPVVTGATLTEWMRDVTGGISRALGGG